MENDGLETLRHQEKHECPPGLHSDVPIIEGNQTVGLVCTTCGRRVRENMELSSLIATPQGLFDMKQRAPSRKDPRF